MALILGLAAAAAPTMAEDLLYRHRNANLNTLKSYEGQPYWAMLAECAGIYGSLANRRQAQGKAEVASAAKAQGIWFLKTATSQLAADRRLPQGEALRLASERVDAGRQTGEAMLGEWAATGLKHEQVIELFCGQVSDTHQAAQRSAGR